MQQDAEAFPGGEFTKHPSQVNAYPKFTSKTTNEYHKRTLLGRSTILTGEMP